MYIMAHQVRVVNKDKTKLNLKLEITADHQ